MAFYFKMVTFHRDSLIFSLSLKMHLLAFVSLHTLTSVFKATLFTITP
jgi:hypothetical protein